MPRSVRLGMRNLMNGTYNALSEAGRVSNEEKLNGNWEKKLEGVQRRGEMEGRIIYADVTMKNGCPRMATSDWTFVLFQPITTLLCLRFAMCQLYFSVRGRFCTVCLLSTMGRSLSFSCLVNVLELLTTTDHV